MSCCCELKSLGFIYDNHKKVYIDPYMDTWGTIVDDYEIVENVIYPSLGGGGLMHNSYFKDIILDCGLEVPTSIYDDSCIVGTSIRIDNQYTRTIYENCGHYDIGKIQQMPIDIYTFGMLYEESSIMEIQSCFNEDGLLIVFPENYVNVENFIYDYVDLMRHIVRTANKYRKRDAA